LSSGYQTANTVQKYKKGNENLGVLIGLKSVAGIDTYNISKYECRIHFKLDK
jgi:hypothetical protein